MTIKKIFLDFYNNNIICFNAKQLDSQSRYVNITCTDHGKKVEITKERMSVRAEYKRPDGVENIVDCTIEDDGTVSLELTKDMLGVCGKVEISIMILSSNVITEGDYDVSREDEITSSLISTMRFYINVVSTTISYPSVESSKEYSSLVETLKKLNSLEIEIANLKSQINESIEKSEETTLEAITLLGEETDNYGNNPEQNTLYGVRNANIDVYTESTSLLGEETDNYGNNPEQNTLYGVRNACIDSINSAGKAAADANAAAERCNGLADEINVSNVVGLQDALDSKSDSDHTHLYAGSKTVGGVANSAEKLETPRAINIMLDNSNVDSSFDGTKDISVGVNGVLPIEYGGTGASDQKNALMNIVGYEPVKAESVNDIKANISLRNEDEKLQARINNSDLGGIVTYNYEENPVSLPTITFNKNNLARDIILCNTHMFDLVNSSMTFNYYPHLKMMFCRMQIKIKDDFSTNTGSSSDVIDVDEVGNYVILKINGSKYMPGYRHALSVFSAVDINNVYVKKSYTSVYTKDEELVSNCNVTDISMRSLPTDYESLKGGSVIYITGFWTCPWS